MTTATMPGSELFTQMTGKAVEAFSMYAAANQRLLREVVDFSASTAKEGVSLYAELQSAAVEAVKDGQSYFRRRQGDLQMGPKDPFGWYQKNALESVEGAQKTLRLLEGNAQAITRSAERLQVTAEQSAKEIQTIVTELLGNVKSLYAPTV